MSLQSDFLQPASADAAKTATSTSSSLLSSSSNNDATSYQQQQTSQTNLASISTKSSHRSNSPQIVNTTRLMAASPMATVVSQHHQQHHQQQQSQSSRPNYITINNSSLSSSPSSPLSFNYEQSLSAHIPNTVNNSNNFSTTTSTNSTNNMGVGTGSAAANNNSNQMCAQIVDMIRRLNIKVIAFDFDCTIVTIHTGGQWLDSPEKLVEFVRPCFRELLPCLLKCDDLYVCVVTYSPQEKLIREVLRILIEDIYKLNDLVNKIIIKGNTKEFLDRYGIEPCYTNGKQLHLDYCRSIFEKREPEKFENSNIFLIDDDLQNIRLALNHGHHAFHVNNNMKLMDLHAFLKRSLEY